MPATRSRSPTSHARGRGETHDDTPENPGWLFRMTATNMPTGTGFRYSCWTPDMKAGATCYAFWRRTKQMSHDTSDAHQPRFSRTSTTARPTIASARPALAQRLSDDGGGESLPLRSAIRRVWIATTIAATTLGSGFGDMGIRNIGVSASAACCSLTMGCFHACGAASLPAFAAQTRAN